MDAWLAGMPGLAGLAGLAGHAEVARLSRLDVFTGLAWSLGRFASGSCCLSVFWGYALPAALALTVEGWSCITTLKTALLSCVPLLNANLWRLCVTT